MNGVLTGNHGYDDGLLNPAQIVGPGGKQILEGYRDDVLNGFAPEKPRYNPVRQPWTGATPTPY